VTFHLEVVTPSRPLLACEADEVSYRADEGYVGIRPQHVPMLNLLRAGELLYETEGKHFRLAVSGGFVEVLPDRVTVLANHAFRPAEVDVTEAEALKQKYSEKLTGVKSEEEFLQASERLRDAEARLSVANQET